MKKALLIGNFGAQNKGDELILRGLLTLCKELELEPLIVSHNPKKTNDEYGFPSTARLPIGFRSLFSFGWVKTLKEFRRSDCVILGGGGLFVDHFRRAVMLWGLHGLAAVLFHKPLIMIGHSFEIKKRCSRFIVKFLCKRAKIVTVRDEASLNFLQKIGISSEKCFLFPDIGFLAFSDAKISRKPVLGITLCKWGLSLDGLEAISDFIQYVLNDGIQEIRLFPFQVGHDNDQTVFKKLLGLNPDKRIKIIDYDDPEFISLFQECAFILGMRLHSILLAFALRIPFTAIAYQSKIVHSVADFGLDKYCLPVNSFTSQNLCDCFEKAQHDKEYFSKYSEYRLKMEDLVRQVGVEIESGRKEEGIN